MKSSASLSVFCALLILTCLFVVTPASAQSVTIWGYTLEGTRVIIQPNKTLDTHSVNIPGFPNEAKCLEAKADQEQRVLPGIRAANNTVVVPASQTYFVGECYAGKYFAVGTE